MILIIMTSIVFTGCIYRSSLPSDWSQLDKKDFCPDLTGHYDANGTASDDTISYFNLWQLIGEDNNDSKKVESVRISIRDTQLLVEAMIGNKVFQQKIIHILNSHCENGLLHIESLNYEENFSGSGAMLHLWRKIDLGKADDGALILRRRTKSLGFYLIPLGGYAWDWFRFAPIQPKE